MGVKMLSRKALVLTAIAISLLMYAAGVLSGLYANKILELKIEHKVKEDVSFLKDYMDDSSLDLKNILLLQSYMDHVNDTCKFSSLYLSNLYEQLGPFWQKLPARLESYEKNAEVSEEYDSLKREYVRLTLRIWLIANHNLRKCKGASFTPVLSFYTKECDTCVAQGEILDHFKEQMNLKNKTVVIFPIDLEFPDDTVYLLAQYYNITTAPTIVVNEKVLHDTIVTEEMLSKVIS